MLVIDEVSLILLILIIIVVISAVFGVIIYHFFNCSKSYKKNDSDDPLPYSTYVLYRFITRFFCLILFMMFLLLFVVILLKTYVLLGGSLK